MPTPILAKVQQARAILLECGITPIEVKMDAATHRQYLAELEQAAAYASDPAAVDPLHGASVRVIA